MPWDITDVPGVTNAEDSTTMAEWRHRQEERQRHSPHKSPHHPPGHPDRPKHSEPEVPAVPDPVDPTQVHRLNILA